MNKVTRRQFLKSSAILGTTTSSIGFGKQPISANTGIEIKQTMVLPVSMEHVLQTLENNFIKVQILSNAEIRVSDKINQQQWQTFKVAIQDETVIRESQLWGRGGRSMGEQYPGRFFGGREGEKLRFRLFGRQNVYEGSFVCTFILKKECLSLQITEIDDSLPSLVFPPPFECDTLVLPNEGGKLLKNESSSIYSGIYRREFLQFFNSLGMRFVGGLNGNNGWLCAYDTKSVDAGAMMINGHITPAWIRSMGNWQGHYQVNYSFTGNGYVGIAKRYRQYAIENGFYKSLKEKIEANPGVEKLLGGRALQFMNYKGKGYDSIKDDYWATDKQIETYKNEYVNFTFKEVMEKIKLAEQKLHFKKGMVLLRGWMHGGYDSAHPDIWPIEPKLGTERDLKEILNLRHKYLTVLHDNYQDFYPTAKSFPKGVVVRKNGKLMSGGMWFGKQCYITNSRDGVRYAKRNLETLKEYAPSGHFIDCVPNNPLHESYEKGNEQTRLEDMQNKYKILKVFHDAGMVVGSERFGDFCIPVLHWIEHSQKRIQGETIPMWQLVFHDAVFACRYNVFERRSPYPSWIEDMFYGNFLHFWIPTNFGTNEPYKCDSLTGWGSWHCTEKEFKNTYHVDVWHQKIGLQEMTSHKFLSDDMKIEGVVYGDKYKMIVNFDNKKRIVNGREFRPYEYELEG